MDTPSLVPPGGATESVWMKTVAIPERPKLQENLQTFACIVGAGLAGLTTAYLLTREGKDVVVIDDGPIGGGETGRTTAQLANAVDDRYFEIERLHGLEGSQISAASHTGAIKLVEQIVTREGIECDFERIPGYLFVGEGDTADLLDKEFVAARKAGLDGVLREADVSVKGFNVGECILFPNQAQFHPLKYLKGLADAVERNGGKIFCRTHANRLAGGIPAVVEIDGGFLITAEKLIDCTNAAVNDKLSMHTKQAPYRTYVVGLRIAKGAVENALYWDTLDPYHYVRLDRQAPDFDVLLVGGEDHKVGHESDPAHRFTDLEEWTRQRFPAAEEVLYRWSGQVIEPVDGVAYLGINPGHDSNVYIITGDSGMGMTHTNIGAMIITDLIMERDNRWAGLYDPKRRSLKSAVEYVKENIDVAVQFGEFITPGDVAHDTDVQRGEGAVVRHGLKKIAVYCDPDGQRHEYSAVCPHLGCIVEWNGVEKSWDCPCHGSRFDAFGRVMNGPSLDGLSPVA